MIAFHPELFAAKAKAQEALEAAGMLWLRDYNCIDLCHEEYGLELEGFSDQPAAQRALRVLKRTFPQWRLGCVWYRDYLGAKWCVSLCRLQRACG